MDFEDILKELGDLGKFQLTTYTLLCLPVFVAAANSLSYVFTAAVPKYRCRVPGCDEGSTNYEEPWMCNILPTNEKAITCEPLQCQMYSLMSNYTANNTCSREMFSSNLVDCDSWVYTEDDWTIVSDWDLTCYKNQWMLALVGTLHFAGIVCGSGLFGFLADRYGRKLVFIFCILLMALTGIMQAISPDYITFCIFIFINALGVSGVYPLAFIIGVEMVSKKHREASGIILNYFYALGEAILGVLGYYIHNWRVLQAIVSAPALLFLVYYWFIPESVRWLIAKRKNEAANKIIKHAAKMNKIQLSEHLLLNIEYSEKKMTHDREDAPETELLEHNIYPMLVTILKSKVMVLRFAMIFYIWAANAFVYYGLSLNSTNMSGNKYINFSLVCLVEIPGYTMAWVSMNHFGRRCSLAISFLICAVACIGAGFVPTEMWWLSTTLSLLGKLGVTSSFGIVYVHTAEMIPTILRSGGVGTASTIARVGAMVAPFVPLLNIYYETLPILLFGAVSLIAALMVTFLPETHNCRLPDTVEEAENIGRVKPPQKFIEKYIQKPLD